MKHEYLDDCPDCQRERTEAKKFAKTQAEIDRLSAELAQARRDIKRKDKALREIYDCGSIRQVELIARAALSPLPN
jgi:peptidoglycan hydrolase CwlO-like protein